MIKRVKISNYKSFYSIEVNLEPLSILFGPNSAGKSNFLDALQLLSRMATKRTLKEAFEPPYRGYPLESFSFDKGGIKSLLGKTSVSFSIEVDVQLSNSIIDNVEKQIKEMRRVRKDEDESSKSDYEEHLIREKYLRYEITVEILPKSGILRVVNEKLSALTSKGEPSKARSPFLIKEGGIFHLRMERQGHPLYLETYMDHTILSRPLYPPHHPHMVAMRQELSNWHFYYFEPRERMRSPNPVKEVRHIGLMGEDLAAYLNTLNSLDPLQFEAVEKALSTMIPSTSGIDVYINDIGEVELLIKENDVPIPARLVSEGTLRILGLLSLRGAKDVPSLIAFEEPENGINPRRIKLVAELLKAMSKTGETQVIATTHSPLLSDLIPDASLYVCSKKEGRTLIEKLSHWGPLGRRDTILRKLDDEEPVSKRMLRGDFDD